jgi:hypothetical protein
MAILGKIRITSQEDVPMDRASRSTARLRTLTVTAAIACAAVLLPAAALAASSAPAEHPGIAAVPQCKSSNIEVWLGLNPDGAAAGTTFYPLEFTNNGFKTHTCYLAGRPGAYATNAQGKRIGPALKGSTGGTKIVLEPGQTANAELGIVQAGFISGCGQTTGVALKVTPPGQSASQLIASFTFPVCKNKPYLHAENVVFGVGIP